MESLIGKVEELKDNPWSAPPKKKRVCLKNRKSEAYIMHISSH